MSNPRSVIEGSKPFEVAQIGKAAPEFICEAVVDGKISKVRLNDHIGKYVVLLFYPRDFTFVCPTELIAFSDRSQEFKNRKCQVLACSTDSEFVHLAWVNTARKDGGLGAMKIPLIADTNSRVAQSYGVWDDERGLCYRGLFIIDDKGIIRQITINDLPVGRSVDETLRLIDAFTFTDIHGEVCPANWKPGDSTIKPNPVGAKDYFVKHG